MEDIYKEADKILKYIVENNIKHFHLRSIGKIIYKDALGKDSNQFKKQYEDEADKDEIDSDLCYEFVINKIIDSLYPIISIIFYKGLITHYVGEGFMSSQKTDKNMFTVSPLIYDFHYSGGFQSEIEAKQLQKDNIKSSIESIKSQKITNWVTVGIAALTLVALVVQIWLS